MQHRNSLIAGTIFVIILLLYLSFGVREYTFERGTGLRINFWVPVSSLSVVVNGADLAKQREPSNCRTISNRRGLAEIPKIIHQSWKTSEVPKKYQEWQRSWKRNHPDWKYMLWTDEANRKLIFEHYSWFLSTYDNFTRGIQRADAARYFYMHRYGGVYADLDFESLKPLDKLLQGKQAVLAYMGTEYNFTNNIPNAWLASRPGHVFWEFCFSEILRSFSPSLDTGDENMYVEKSTGPEMLFRAVERYQKTCGEGGLNLLEAGVIYPFEWRSAFEKLYEAGRGNR